MCDRSNDEGSGLEKENKKIFAYIGFAARSKKLVSGTERVLACVRKGTGATAGNMVVLLAENSSDRTKKQLHDKCAYYGVNIFEFSSSEILGNIAGKESTASAVCITDKSLAAAVIELLGKR